jgi:nitrite reductase (NADH) large subunit
MAVGIRPNISLAKEIGLYCERGVVVNDTLQKVETEEQVLEYCAAFLQLYREEAHYLERTAPWIERVGLNHVQKHMVEDAENRKILAQRFLEAQKHAQIDPWQQRATEGVDQHEFTFLKELS